MQEFIAERKFSDVESLIEGLVQLTEVAKVLGNEAPLLVDFDYRPEAMRDVAARLYRTVLTDQSEVFDVLLG